MTAELRPKPSLVGRVTLVYSLTLALSLLAVIGASLVLLTWRTNRSLELEGQRAASWLGAALAGPLWNLDNEAVSLAAEGLISNGVAESVEVWDGDGVPVFASGTSVPGAQTFEAPVRRGQASLGRVKITLPRSALAQAASDLASLGGIQVLLLILVLALATPPLLRTTIRQPLEEITAVIEGYGDGGNDPELQFAHREFDTIARALGSMNATIRHQREAWTQLNQSLEAQVEVRTRALIQAEKLASLGKLVAVFAHELNTPLGVVNSSSQLLVNQGGRVLAGLFPAGQADLAADALQQAGVVQRVVERSEWKAWSRSWSPAGVAPEAIRAVQDLVTDLGLWPLRDRLTAAAEGGLAPEFWRQLEDACSLVRSAALIQAAGGKASQVIRALRIYLKEDVPGPQEAVDLAANLEEVLPLIGDSLRGNVEVRRQYEAGLEAWAFRQSLEQVWLNLLVNAFQAMAGTGVLTLRTTVQGPWAVVEVEDTGPGIPEVIRDRVFDPFFSTKESGGGMGLGLDICRQILQAQGGSIGFTSRPGQTIFRVELPPVPPEG